MGKRDPTGDVVSVRFSYVGYFKASCSKEEGRKMKKTKDQSKENLQEE